MQSDPDIDIVLSDINMPEMDGLTLLAKLNVIAPLIKTVIISAYGDMENIRRAMNDGAFDFLTKPIDFQDLEITINKTLQHVQQLKENSQSRFAATKAQMQAYQLQQALSDLKKAQSELIQVEKMSSLGQMVAGVAHEINNPVSFIYGNLQHTSLYIKDVFDLLRLYQRHFPDPGSAISEKIEEIDLDFLMQDLPKALSSMEVGAVRIHEIVLALRNFSRLDEAEMKPVDIHSGINSTLLILQSRLQSKPGRPGIEIIKEYGNLPLVECYAGQLNQVFMNILLNASDALEKQDSPRIITIRTLVNPGSTFNAQLKKAPHTQEPENGQARVPDFINKNQLDDNIASPLQNSSSVLIQIADNGPGMTSEVNKRLFDPFFTTKPVGAGTGLGLSISYQIVVEKHGGKLQCNSAPGQGAEFIIEIPINQQNSEKLT